MADTKTTGLTATTTPASTDIIAMVVDPGGTPLDRKCTLANLKKGIGTSVSLQGKYLLYDNTLASPGTFDTNGTDLSGYDNLEVLAVLRGARTDISDNLLWAINNDTTDAHYKRLMLRMDTTNTLKIAAADRAFGNIPAASGTAGLFGVFYGIIPAYTSTSIMKQIQASNTADVGATSYLGVYSGVLQWYVTDALTRIALQGYTTANFVAGSRLQIWGVKQYAILTTA